MRHSNDNPPSRVSLRLHVCRRSPPQGTGRHHPVHKTTSSQRGRLVETHSHQRPFTTFRICKNTSNVSSSTCDPSGTFQSMSPLGFESLQLAGQAVCESSARGGETHWQEGAEWGAEEELLTPPPPSLPHVSCVHTHTHSCGTHTHPKNNGPGCLILTAQNAAAKPVLVLVVFSMRDTEEAFQ